METQKAQLFLSWENINDLLDTIHFELIHQAKADIACVTGIPRGGLILAVLYSHRFNTHFLTHRTLLENSVDLDLDKVLVLDDIADSGHTLSKWKNHSVFGQCIFATLYTKEISSIQPDIHAAYMPKYNDSWIVFPWERRDSETLQDYLKK